MSILNWEIFDPRMRVNFRILSLNILHTCVRRKLARAFPLFPFIIKYARVRTKGARTLAAITGAVRYISDNNYVYH